MRQFTRSIGRGTIAVAALLAIGAPVAVAEGGNGHRPRPVKVVASRLEGPFGLQAGAGNLYVAESGAGRITEVKPATGRKKVVVRGLTNPTGVDRTDGVLAIVTGGADEPDPSITGDASLFVARPGRGRRLLADLEAYELANNPDGQRQFDESGEPLDALSNPFAVLGQRGRGFVLVADAGANAVLSVTRAGKVSTFFVPPVVKTGSCEGRPNNDPRHAGCDSVPTGLAYGPNNRLYVSTLSGEAPRQGRVYVLNGRTGKVLDVIRGLTAPTGVAVSRNGTVFVSEVLYNAPEGEPPPGFDPSTVGRIVRIARNGTRTEAAVTMPLGLVFHRGSLYSSAWSVAGFVGLTEAGQVVKVRPSAFS